MHSNCHRELLKEESEGLLKLPTDKALLEDPQFRHFVELYAKVQLVTEFLFRETKCNVLGVSMCQYHYRRVLYSSRLRFFFFFSIRLNCWEPPLKYQNSTLPP